MRDLFYFGAEIWYHQWVMISFSRYVTSLDVILYIDIVIYSAHRQDF